MSDDSETFGERIARLALARVGFGAGETPLQYGEWLGGPGESAQMCRDMARMSGCGLVRRRLETEAGIHDGRLVAPYELGYALEHLRQIATERNAIRTPTVGTAPELAVGASLCMRFGRPDQHILTVTKVLDCGLGFFRFEAVEGGQIDPRPRYYGEQIIATKTHRLQVTGGQLFDVPENPPGFARSVSWWTDPEAYWSLETS